MKRIEVYFCYIFFFLITLTNCEGTKAISGIVISNKNGVPISNAEINVLNHYADSTITDLNGKYNLQGRFGSMIFGGPKFKFEIKKKGFESMVCLLYTSPSPRDA